MFDSDTQGFYKSEQQESSIMRRSFNPHALQRRAPLLHVGAVYHHEFQSTRPIRGATYGRYTTKEETGVSIHAPRVGRDVRLRQCSCARRCFNPRAPCGARLHYRHNTTLLFCFNPRAPCGARPHFALMYAQSSTFQSTRPVWGATPSKEFCKFFRGFQSTRPVWGATPTR